MRGAIESAVGVPTASKSVLTMNTIDRHYTGLVRCVRGGAGTNHVLHICADCFDPDRDCDLMDRTMDGESDTVTESDAVVYVPCALSSETIAMAEEGERATARHAMMSAIATTCGGSRSARSSSHGVVWLL